VRIALSGDNVDLRPGAFAHAEVPVDSTLGVIVPQTAVLSDEQGNYVLIVDVKNTVQRRPVTVVAARSEGLLISAGLDGKERVVAIAGAFLRAGEAVVIAGQSGVS
jgi:HlyD family secretion protein